MTSDVAAAVSFLFVLFIARPWVDGFLTAMLEDLRR